MGIQNLSRKALGDVTEHTQRATIEMLVEDGANH